METTKQLSEAAAQYLHDTSVGVARMVLVMPSFTRRQIDNSELGADVIPTLQLRTALVRDTVHSGRLRHAVWWWGDQLVAVLGLVCTRLTSDTSLTVGCIAIPSPGPSITSQPQQHY